MLGHSLRPGTFAAAILAACFIAGERDRCLAEPPPSATARGQFAEAGTFEIVVRCDVAGFMVQTVAGQLDGHAADALKKISDEELRAQLEHAQRAFSQQLRIEFDGRLAPSPVVRFPTLDELRAEPPQEIRIDGKTPPRALQCTLTFPLGIGPVDLTLQGMGAERLRQSLEKGETSAPFFLKGEPEVPPREPPRPPGSWRFWAYSILIAVLLTVLGLRTFLKPGAKKS